MSLLTALQYYLLEHLHNCSYTLNYTYSVLVTSEDFSRLNAGEEVISIQCIGKKEELYCIFSGLARVKGKAVLHYRISSALLVLIRLGPDSVSLACCRSIVQRVGVVL